MVSVAEWVNEEIILTDAEISPPPVDMLPTDCEVKDVFHANTKGFETNGKKWRGKDEVYSIFTDSFLLVIAIGGTNLVTGEEDDEYIKIPYGAVNSVEYSSPLTSLYKKIEFESLGNNCTIFTHKGEKRVELAANLLSTNTESSEITEGTTKELQLKESNNSELSETLHGKMYNSQEGTIDSFRNEAVLFNEDNIMIPDIDSSIKYSDIVDISDYEYKYVCPEFVSFRKGIEMISNGENHLILYLDNRADDSDSGSFPDFYDNVANYIYNHIEPSSKNRVDEYTLIGPFNRNNYSKEELKVEGWTDGDSNVDMDLSAKSASKGKSKGLEVGPFTRSKSSSTSEIQGDISGSISDNTFSSDIKSLKIYEEKIVIDSKLYLELGYEDISAIHKIQSRSDGGINIQTSEKDLRVTVDEENRYHGSKLDEIIEYIRDKLTDRGQFEDSGHKDDENSPSDRLSELESLREKELISEEEYQQKKSEILNDL